MSEGKDLSMTYDDMVIPIMFKNAKSGDTSQARSLIQIAADCLTNGTDFPDTLKPYLAKAFQEIAEGKSADVALYLKHGRGQNDTALYKKQAIAKEVNRLYWTWEAATILEACEIVHRAGISFPGTVTGLIHPDSETAKKYYYEIFPGTPERCPM